jgi:hypothetical protein
MAGTSINIRAFDRTIYVGADSATLEIIKTETLAEMSRLRLAGQDFGLPGGRTRHGVRYDQLMQELSCVLYALNANADSESGVPSQTQITVADLSS